MIDCEVKEKANQQDNQSDGVNGGPRERRPVTEAVFLAVRICKKDTLMLQAPRSGSPNMRAVAECANRTEGGSGLLSGQIVSACGEL